MAAAASLSQVTKMAAAAFCTRSICRRLPPSSWSRTRRRRRGSWGRCNWSWADCFGRGKCRWLRLLFFSIFSHFLAGGKWEILELQKLHDTFLAAFLREALSISTSFFTWSWQFPKFAKVSTFFFFSPKASLAGLPCFPFSAPWWQSCPLLIDFQFVSELLSNSPESKISKPFPHFATFVDEDNFSLTWGCGRSRAKRELVIVSWELLK